MTQAAALDALAKAAQASVPFRQQPDYVDQRAVPAARMVKITRNRPLISPDVHAQLVKASGMSAVADQLRANSGLTRLSEQLGAQIAQSVKTSGIADQVAAQWSGQLQAIIDRSGIGHRLTATMRQGLTDLYTPSPLWTWDLTASTAETLRPIGREGLGSVIEVVADVLEDGPVDAASRSPVDLIRDSAATATIGWTFVQSYCAQHGPDIPLAVQQRITIIIAAWALLGLALPSMVRLATYAVRSD